MGDELPIGWEEVVDPTLGVYFVDHINRMYILFIHIFSVVKYMILLFDGSFRTDVMVIFQFHFMLINFLVNNIFKKNKVKKNL